ncbi:MAG: enoyl-CoA hydratase/isomerase family protein [Rubrobacter sp.]|nr:enoyl-CoA hydratase/isomerase family protein [Rubrobacter sp.]
MEEGIARIQLDRPHRLNAVIPDLVEDLCGALDRARRDGVGAVVLAGRGRAFCSGADLKHEEPPVGEAEERRRLQRVQDVSRKIRQSPHPVVAAVHGYALGAGCEFALCSDLVVAARDATFGFPEVEVGRSVTGGISHVLPAAVGLVRAKELLLLGERFGAEEARRLGLVNRVVEPEELEEAALNLARKLRDRPRAAVSRAKFAVDRGAQSDIGTAYEVEVDYALAARVSGDAGRGNAAFRRDAEKERG